MYDILRSGSFANRAICADLRRNFSLYELGTEFDFCDIELLAFRDDGPDRVTLVDIAFKLLRELHRCWFGDVCVAPGCVRETKLVCSVCKEKICCSVCQGLHDESCKY
jgi:hypothetical protein